MDLITTHKNADFDALSSLVAASKLYPNARLLLPGSQEKAVRDFLALIKDKVKIETDKTCRMDDVTRLVVVDNRHRSRLGSAARLLDKKSIEVHIYDHHPSTRFDIKADRDISKEVGATVTILLEILAKENKLDLSPLEATLMLLGIYEETGSLSYLSTTKLDVDMVSLLLEKGARLNVVSLYLNRELSEKELSIFIKLLESIEIVNINGLGAAFSHVTADRFDGEMGAVVHKLQDVENFPVLFAFFQSKDRIKLLARSRIEDINVNKLLRPFNGAGHPTAAGAKLEGQRVADVKSKLVHMLQKLTRPEVYARDIMSYPVETVSQEEKVNDVFNKLKRLGFRGAPVRDGDNKLVGMITLGNLKKALKHEMGHSRVKGYTAIPLISAAPETPLNELKKIVVAKGKGLIPIIKDEKLVGIVTRTDVLKNLHGSFFFGNGKGRFSRSEITAKMNAHFPKKLMKLIKFIAKEGDQMNMGTFLVGGLVRDLFLHRKNYDLDIVVEGNAIEFGKILSKKIGGSLVVHRKFGTATIVKEWPEWLEKPLLHDNKFKIDIATARKERYEEPAALPTVEFSSLKDDLYRRDFTINAMAININKDSFGQFIDFFEGLKDLEKGLIRSLHDKSFIDDPTRIFRAVRFEQRFGFRIEAHTEYLIKHAVRQDMFHRTENQRIRDELILMLSEATCEKAVFRMAKLHELRFIHPELVLNKSARNIFAKLQKCVKWYEAALAKSRRPDTWLMNFMVMLNRLTLKEVEDVLNKFVFTRKESAGIYSYKKYADKNLKKLSSSKKMPPSRIYALLEKLPHEVILCMMARAAKGPADSRIKKFFTEHSKIVLKISGHDIKKHGIHPGPRYTGILRTVLYEKLDGGFKTKRDEQKYLKKLLKKNI